MEPSTFYPHKKKIVNQRNFKKTTNIKYGLFEISIMTLREKAIENIHYQIGNNRENDIDFNGY